MFFKQINRRHRHTWHFPHGYLEYKLHQILVNLCGDDKGIVKLEVLHKMLNDIK